MEVEEKTLRILGKRGRVTIPQEVRDAIGMARGDVVSFAVVGDDCALVKRERICDNCSTEPPQMIKLLMQAMHLAENNPQSQRAFEFLTSLSPAQQLELRSIFILPRLDEIAEFCRQNSGKNHRGLGGTGL